MTTDNEEELDPIAYARKLINAGYAVIIWTPDELKGLDPDHMQCESISFGWDLINNHVAAYGEST